MHSEEVQMFKWLKNDLSEIPSDLYEMLHDWWKSHASLKEAPPSTRKKTIGILPILKDGAVIGSFSPDLYEIAEMNYLRCQMEKNDSEVEKSGKKPPYISLKKADGTEKTSFELALLPIAWSDDNPKSISIRKVIEEEYNNLMQKGLSLPPIESKYQIAADYLRNLAKTGYKIGAARDVSVTLLNPRDKTSFYERLLHYIAQRAAFLLTITAALLIIPVTSSVYVPLAVLGVFLAQWCGKEFFTFDLTETLMQEMNSRIYSNGKPISAKKLIKTSLLLGVLLLAAASIGMGAAYEMMSLAWPAATSAVFATLLTAAHYLLAGFVGFFAAASTFVGGVASQNYFWGIGIRYKQVDFKDDLTLDKPLAPLTERQVLSPLQTRDKLLHWRYKSFHQLGSNLNETQIQKIRQAYVLLADALSVTLEPAVAAPDAPMPADTPMPANAPVLSATPILEEPLVTPANSQPSTLSGRKLLRASV